MEIRIDPSQEPKQTLRALATFLSTIAGDVEALEAQYQNKVKADDRPDAGASSNAVSITGGFDQLYAELTGGDLKAAFGGSGNVVGVSPTAHFPPPASTGAAFSIPPIPMSTEDAVSPEPDLAAAFGGNNPPNVVGAAPSTPPSGLPPVPSNLGATAGVELDSDGLPWDASIHSSNKKKTADTGRWQRRRNVPDNVFDAKVAQLRAAVSVGNVAPPLAPPPIPTAIPLPATTPGAAVSNSAATLATLLPRITSAMAAGQLTAETAAAIAMELSGGKINNVAMLAVAPQLIPAFSARLDLLGVA